MRGSVIVAKTEGSIIGLSIQKIRMLMFEKKVKICSSAQYSIRS